MNKNTRKFIWHGLFGFIFLCYAAYWAAIADSFYDWVLFGINVILCAINFKKVEQTLKED